MKLLTTISASTRLLLIILLVVFLFGAGFFLWGLKTGKISSQASTVSSAPTTYFYRFKADRFIGLPHWTIVSTPVVDHVKAVNDVITGDPLVDLSNVSSDSSYITGPGGQFWFELKKPDVAIPTTANNIRLESFGRYIPTRDDQKTISPNSLAVSTPTFPNCITIENCKSNVFLGEGYKLDLTQPEYTPWTAEFINDPNTKIYAGFIDQPAGVKISRLVTYFTYELTTISFANGAPTTDPNDLVKINPAFTAYNVSSGETKDIQINVSSWSANGDRIFRLNNLTFDKENPPIAGKDYIVSYPEYNPLTRLAEYKPCKLIGNNLDCPITLSAEDPQARSTINPKSIKIKVQVMNNIEATGRPFYLGLEEIPKSGAVISDPRYAEINIPSPAFSISPANLNFNPANAGDAKNVTIELINPAKNSRAANKPVDYTVHYQATNGTAKYNEDYVLIVDGKQSQSGTIKISASAGNFKKNILVKVLKKPKAQKNFTITLDSAAPAPYAIISNYKATVTLTPAK